MADDWIARSCFKPTPTDLFWSFHIGSCFYCMFDFRTWLDTGIANLTMNQFSVSLYYLFSVFRLGVPFHGTAFETHVLICYFYHWFSIDANYMDISNIHNSDPFNPIQCHTTQDRR
eukprot:496575_1